MRTLLVATALLLSSCGLEAVSGLAEPDTESSEVDTTPTLDLSPRSGPPSAGELPDVIDAVLPSVVNIRVEAVDFELGSPQTVRGQGSGVVIDDEGIILTNAHVVQDSTKVTVVFNDDHGSLDGEVLGVAPEKDIAVVKVSADDLTPVALGRSSDLRLGHEVVAVGFPLGLGGPTVTKGIVSALDRNIEVNAPALSLEGLIQTDAAINPGNSGGALVDLAGRLVGVNTAAAQAGAAENIGFAIPVDAALPIAEEIVSEPPERRAWLGVQIRSIESAAAAAQVGFDPGVRGALVVGLFPDSAAGDGGIVAGDLILDVGGFEIASGDDLTQALTRFDPGDEVDIVVLRGGGETSLQVTLAQRPASIPVPEG